MHHRKKRQRDLLKRTLTYIFMTLSVITLVVVSLFLVLGYSVDKEGQPEQGGLIQFRSFPTGATVYVDGAKQSFTTNGKNNSSAGYHSVSMNLKQYRGWSKNFDLGSGELLWLNALLIPQKITTSEAQTFDQLHSARFSPDKNWMAAIEKPQEAKIKLVDLRDEKKPVTTEIDIPEIVAKEQTPDDVFKIVEWDFGSRYILATYTTGDKTQWLRIDRSNPDNARNISVLKNIAIQDAHFVGNSGNVFYVLTDGFIRKVDITKTNETVKNVAEGVREFDQYRDDRLGFVASRADKQEVGFYNETDNKTAILREYKPEETNVHTAISNYFNDDYQAVSYGTKVEVIRNPLQEKKVVAKFELAQGVRWLYFSNNGRFVVAQNGSSLSIYDLERNQNFVFTIPNNPEYTLDHHLKWLDDFHLVSDAGNTLTIFEYDGTNAETIGDVIQGFDVSLSDNGKRLFSIGTNTVSNKPVLLSSVMVIE